MSPRRGSGRCLNRWSVPGTPRTRCRRPVRPGQSATATRSRYPSGRRDRRNTMDSERSHGQPSIDSFAAAWTERSGAALLGDGPLASKGIDTAHSDAPLPSPVRGASEGGSRGGDVRQGHAEERDQRRSANDHIRSQRLRCWPLECRPGRHCRADHEIRARHARDDRQAQR